MAARRSPARGIVLSLFAMFSLMALPVVAQDDALFTGSPPKGNSADEPSEVLPDLITAEKEWTVLHLFTEHKENALTLPDDSKMFAAIGFTLTGPYVEHPHLFGAFEADSPWGIRDGWLHRSAGENGALRVAIADEFELQGLVQADGLGGWFILVGWAQGHGYMIYNVTLKQSGSPWHICEFRDSTGIANTHREITRYEWKKRQPLVLKVQDARLTMKAGRTFIAKEEPLPNYHQGQILIGTYEARPYGAKRLGIQSLRIRALDAE